MRTPCRSFRVIAVLLCIFGLIFSLTAPQDLGAATGGKYKKEKKDTKKKSGKKNSTKNDKSTDAENNDPGNPENVPPEEAKIQKEQKKRIVPNELKVPYLSTYYLEPVLAENSRQTFRFYVTDWDQSEYRRLETGHKFTVRITYGPKSGKNQKTITKNGIPAGDHEAQTIELAPGEYRASLCAEDEKGRRSPVLYHEFLVKTPAEMTISEDETYVMTENDLKKYDIQSKGDFGVFAYRSSSKENDVSLEDFRREMLDKTPDNGYLVMVFGRQLKLNDKAVGPGKPGAYDCPMPEWIPDLGGWRQVEITYKRKYSAKEAEAEAVRTGKGLNKLFQDVRAKGKRKLVMLKGYYRISNTTTLEVPSGLTLDLNGSTVKLNQFAGCGGLQIRIRDGFDTHVVNGIVEGDYFEHDYAHSEKNSEWVCGIGMDGDSKYSSFENILVRYITGYGVTHGFHGNYGMQSVGKLKRGTIDRQTGKKIDSDVLAVTGFLGIEKFAKQTPYLTVSRFLGYQGIGADEWNILYHFYDASKNYLTTIDGWQYRRVLIPPKAAFMRVTVYAQEIPEESPLTVNFFKSPWNSWYKNLFITNARCVGMAPGAMYNFKVENCTFMRSGESGAFCAFDAEDGWDMMQDVWIVRNLFNGNGRNDLLTCGGHNFIFEENVGKIHLWNGSHGYVARKNKFGDAFFGSASRARSLLVRVYDNVFNGSLRFAEDLPVDGWTVAIRNAPPGAKCGEAGVMVGGKYTELMTKSVNMLGAELNNCDIDVFKSRFTKCKFNYLTGGFGGNTVFDRCEFNMANVEMTQVSDIQMKKCKLEAVSFTYKYNVAPSTFAMTDCTLKSTFPKKPFIQIPCATLKDLKFTNCRLETGPVHLLHFTHWNNSNQPASVLFDSCTVTGKRDFVVGHIPIEEDDTIMPVSFTATNCILPENFVRKAPKEWSVDNRGQGSGCSLND